MYNCIVLRHWKRTYLTPQKPIVNSLALCAICFRRYFLPCESSNEFYHPLDEGFWNLFVNRYAYWFPHCFVIIDVATKIKQSSSGDDGLLFMLWELCVDIPRWLQYLKVVFNFPKLLHAAQNDSLLSNLRLSATVCMGYFWTLYCPQIY